METVWENSAIHHMAQLGMKGLTKKNTTLIGAGGGLEDFEKLLQEVLFHVNVGS